MKISCSDGWYGIEVFDAYPQYGDGHSQWIGKKLTGDRIDYLYIGFAKDFEFHWFWKWHTYYDGYHHVYQVLWFMISWKGWPFTKDSKLQ